jgi:serine/threonine-protein kinase
VVGSGAHGIVYCARDLETRDEVAIKLLNDAHGFESEYCERLEREASAMARLRDTHAVRIHHLGLLEQRFPFLVMEMLYGRDLDDHLTEASERKRDIEIDELVDLLDPIVHTLEVAHRQGIVHRDLKPSNIFLIDEARGGGVRLLDFGLAKILDEGTLTSEGFVAGTPSYIAPESWKGNPRLLDHRIDVYSLGIISYRALAGALPTPGRGVLDIYEWACSGARPSLHAARPDLPEAIDAWVQRALAIDPDQRFDGVRRMWSALATLGGR